jgi:uncharacterized protein (UPF0335 family)
MLELQKAGPPPGLYPAEWLAAEAERLEQEHDDIELAKNQVIVHTKTLLDKHAALKTEKASYVQAGRQLLEKKAALQTEMVDHVRAAQQLDAQIEALKERGHPEIEVPLADIRARKRALVDARVNLALLAGSSGAPSAVTEVFDRHKSLRDKRLKTIADRIMRLTEERDAISEDIRDIYAEAKCNGYDVAALRQLVKTRRGARQLDAGNCPCVSS